MLSRVLCFMLGLAVLGVALRVRAEIPRELDGLPIVEVEIQGGIAPSALPPDTGIPLGAALRRATLRQAISNLLASQRFTNVQIDALPAKDGVKLVLWLTPRLLLHRLDVVGTEHVDEQQVRDALSARPGSELTPEQLQKLTSAVTKLYARHGYLGPQIELTLRDTDDPTRKVLLLQIEEGTPTRIEYMRFQGEQPLDPGRVMLNMKSALGDVLNRQQLEDDVTKAEAYLRRQGFLEAALSAPLITIKGERAFIAIPSHIGPRYRVVVTGQAPFSRSEMSDVLALKSERLSTTHLRHTLAERIKDFYARHGFGSTQVKVQRYRGQAKGQVVLSIAIVPGPQLRVVSVSFAGARHFSRAFLRDQLFSYLSEELPGSSVTAPVDSEVVDRFDQGERAGQRRDVAAPPITNPELFYYEPVYEKAIEHIAELYRSEGYLSVHVGKPQVQRIGKDRAAVFMPITEGPRTLLHQVVVRGAQAFSPRELLVTAGLLRNQPFSYLAIEQARRRIVDAYQEKGYAFAKVEANVRFSNDGTRASVDLEVVERFEVTVDRILVVGANNTSHALIRRVVTLKPSDLYRPSAARESERELAALGVFTGISVALQDPELPARVKSVVVTVSERSNQFLDFTAGLSTGQGVRGGFEYGYRNLFGQAVGLTLRVQLAYQLFFVDREIADRFDALSPQDQLERRITLGTTIPRLPGLGRVRTSVDLVHLRDNERDFGLDQNAAGLTFSLSPVRHVTLTLGGDLENNNVDLFVGQALQDYLATVQNARLRRLLRVPEGTSTLVAGRTSASYDRRDSAFTPTRGYFLSINTELAGTLSGEPDEFEIVDEFVSRFLKLSLTASGYIPLGPIVLAGQARAGRILHLSGASKTYPNRAFFLGGVDTIRGYLEDELIPQDIADEIAADATLNPNAIVRSGDAFVLLRGEFRFPIYRELRGGVFSDLGNLWADPAHLDPLELRPTAGVGLRIDTPVGPIALDWGFNLDPRSRLNERQSALHFSIGLF